VQETVQVQVQVLEELVPAKAQEQVQETVQVQDPAAKPVPPPFGC
jgi:hypothetical protein